MSRASITLADGRELIYFGGSADWAAGYQDRREIGRAETSSQVRYDPLLGEWVIVAGHRQDRSESGMGAFTNDVAPEAAAAALREDT